jgi:GMP synthase (glutamine-hydrolysing)
MVLRLLVIEGNVRAARERHQAAFGKTYSQSYAELLAELAPNSTCDICFAADQGANLVASLSAYDGVAITGSALNLYDGGPPVDRQLELVRAVFSARIPCFGSCWGLQLASAAAGGTVARNPLGREVGVARNIALTDFGKQHPMLTGRPLAFDAPCVHLDIVTALPAGASILATNAFTAVQAAEIWLSGGVFWGVQYHPEFSLSEIASIVERTQSTLIKEQILADAEQASAYCRDLRALDRDPSNRSLAWRLGIQPEVLDPHLRLTEIRNWLAYSVRPEQSRRHRA